MFELIQRDALPQYDDKRYQVGFTVEDIHAARAELISRGAAPLTEIEPTEPGSHNLWCYFRDSEGNVFEITQWLDRTPPSAAGKGLRVEPRLGHRQN
jgi:predicted enzyme related to lactoylglutathione lyase